MSILERQVDHARRRLTGNVLARNLAAAVLLAAGLWGLSIVVVRGLGLPVPLGQAGLGAGLLAGLSALCATWFSRPSRLHAAARLDAAANLKERLSTALAMRHTADPFVQAAVRDAERVAARVKVPAHIPLQAPRFWPWSLASLLAALILLRLMPNLNLLSGRERTVGSEQRAAALAEHQVIQTELEDRLQRITELAQDNPDSKEALESLVPAELPDSPDLTPEDVRREAVKRIDELAERLRRELESPEKDPFAELKRLLSRLEVPGSDPTTDNLIHKLASGDFENAGQAIEQLSQKLQAAAANPTDPRAQQQLQQMQQQLSSLADQLNRVSDPVHLRKELQNKAALSPDQAGKVLESLEKVEPTQVERELQKLLSDKSLPPRELEQLARKIRQGQQACQACRKIGQRLAEAAQACDRKGADDAAAKQAGAALSEVAGQLARMQRAQKLTNELQSQLSDLERLRDRVVQGRYSGPESEGQRRETGSTPGTRYGLGEGPAVGSEDASYQLELTEAQTQFQGGAVIGQMLVDGPQIRGQASAEVLAAAESQVRDALDAIEREEVPREYRQALQEYFEHLAGLVRRKQAAQDDETVGQPP